MKKFLILICFIYSNICFSQDNSNFDLEQIAIKTQDNELKDLVWNKWQTKNFIILSIDKTQGLYLKNNIERIKIQTLSKWGFEDINFTTECKLLCVPNEDLLKKLFKLDSAYSEIRKDKDKINLTALWFVFNNDIDLSQKITDICLSELEQNNNINLPLFCKVGMIKLNQDFTNVKKDLNNKNLIKINSKDLLNKKVDDLSKVSKENLDIFEKQSAVAVLLFRKEYGQDNFLNYIKTNDLKSFGIKNIEELDKILNRYSKNLITDLEDNKVPQEYIEINRR